MKKTTGQNDAADLSSQGEELDRCVQDLIGLVGSVESAMRNAPQALRPAISPANSIQQAAKDLARTARLKRDLKA